MIGFLQHEDSLYLQFHTAELLPRGFFFFNCRV